MPWSDLQVMGDLWLLQANFVRLAQNCLILREVLRLCRSPAACVLLCNKINHIIIMLYQPFQHCGKNRRLVSEGRSPFDDEELHHILGSILSRPPILFGFFAPGNDNLASHYKVLKFSF